MKIAFTLCSNNFLAQAKTLGDSLLFHNPDYKFIVGLVDKRNSEIDYSFFKPHEIVPIDLLRPDAFEQMWRNYWIVELITSLKPFYFSYLFNKYPEANSVIYFDPDIMIFNKLYDIEKGLTENSFILTPHIATPMKLDGFLPNENTFLNHGLYNLGFLALARSNQVCSEFLLWWEERMKQLCLNNVSKGLFVDQLWANYIPIFFTDVEINNNPGLNMAYWNLHERKLSEQNGTMMVNGHTPLVFYHFSAYKQSEPESIAGWKCTRYSFKSRPELKTIYKLYRDNVLNNRYELFRNIPCYYTIKRNEFIKQKGREQIFSSKKNILKYYVGKVIPRSIKNLIKKATSL